MDELKKQLIRHEALRFKPYDDATGKELKKGDVLRGKLTIGIGWNLSDVAIPQAIVDAMYDTSIKRVDADLREQLPWIFNLDEVRRDVLRNLCFNMGINTLLEFKNTLESIRTALITNGSYDAAADNLKKSAWYTQVGARGVELVEQLRTGNRIS